MSDAEIQARIEASRRAGFSEGEAAARRQLEEQTRETQDRLAQSLAALASLRSRIRREAEEDLVRLSLAIARKILGRELALDPDSIQALTRLALEKLQAAELQRVRIHPSHEKAIRTSLERFGTQGVEIMADASLALGDIRFETVRGVLDASIDSQLREVERGFADRLQVSPWKR